MNHLRAKWHDCPPYFFAAKVQICQNQVLDYYFDIHFFGELDTLVFLLRSELIVR